MKGDSIYGTGISIEGYCSTGSDFSNYDQSYYGCDMCEHPADQGSIKLVAYGPDMEKKTVDTVDCSFNSGCTDCLWGHVTGGYDGEGTCSWCKGVQARASQCSCRNTLANKTLQAAANPDNWFTYPVTIRLPTTLLTRQHADGPGSGYKGLKVEKDPDSDSDATGVDLCITKIEKKGDEETVETTKKSVKFGGELGDITAHATLERYSCESYDETDRPYDDYEKLCGEKLHSKRSITIPGEDASVEWHITVLQCTYD